MSTTNILIAGFGGQGVLFVGKLLAYQGLIEDKNVSWLPSYGPEMRGGTANCSVIVSDTPIGSPIIDNPDILIAMNLPSLDKYEKSVAKGGKIFVDSFLIERKVERADVDTYYVPATQMASDSGATALANMVILGKVMRETNFVDYANITEALKKVVSARHRDLIEFNLKALDMGHDFE